MTLVLPLDHDGKIPKKGIDYLGGEFNFIQSLINGGTGSTKFIYLSGIKEFDSLVNTNQDTFYTTFEVFKNGLALRSNKRNSNLVLLIKFSDIKAIEIISKRIIIKYKFRDIIKKKAEVIINTNRSGIKLGLLPIYYNEGIKYFSKKVFSQKCEFIIKEKALDESEDLGWLSMIDGLL